ncbi:hypothetical protein BN946_scf184305.g3 [Trametes cinnabarina]|uniref:BTB domain-containing protein n=1 Tax=Pycnoporus cinnabarinus TaxID=5643 RepID=A0A060SR79_PYCCI|nr:hypothetical protein BN946_scf184305.g3 [Trametes cinnabarina]
MVHKSILAAASPILAAKIASAALQRANEDPKTALKITLPESDSLLETLLRYMYPSPDPVLLDMSSEGKTMVRPSATTLDHSSTPASVGPVEELAHIPATGADAVSLLKSHPKRPRLSPARRSASLVCLGLRKVSPPPFNAPDADLVIRTSADTTFMVHKVIVAAASPVLAAKIASAAVHVAHPDNPAVDAATASLEIALPESEFVLETLLRYIYPLPEPVLLDLDDIAAVYDAAANRYSFACATSALQRALSSPRFLDAEPVRIYALAKRFGLEDLARTALRDTLRHPAVWPDYDEFTEMPASHYRTPLAAHRAIRRDAVECLRSLDLTEKALPHTARTLPVALRCNRGFKCWWEEYKERACPLLLEIPTSDRVCDAAFVAELADDVGCLDCRHALLVSLRPGAYVQQLKEVIDALPTKHGV